MGIAQEVSVMTKKIVEAILVGVAGTAAIGGIIGFIVGVILLPTIIVWYAWNGIIILKWQMLPHFTFLEAFITVIAIRLLQRKAPSEITVKPAKED